MNHEIVGKPTQTEYGVKFMRNYDDFTIGDLQNTIGQSVFTDDEVDSDKVNDAYAEIVSNPKYSAVIEKVPNRHPAQLYEALAYFIIFLLLMGGYLYTPVGSWKGFIFGSFLLLAFGARFIIEFFKEVQVAFEENMTLDLGQWLSIPLVAAGVFFIARAAIVERKKVEANA